MTPEHIGFIMDGNGRWATEHGMPRPQGYAQGVVALYNVAKRCEERGVKAITVYALSTENLQRPADELRAIFKAVEKFNFSYDGNFVITYMGDISQLPDSLAESICFVEEKTCSNDGMLLNIALNYGGRSDIVRAAKLAYDHGEFVDGAFEKYLSSAHLPQLDLIVRTGGQMRLSNFMLYECAYSELMFVDKLWPDMDENDVDDAIAEFERRQRKFGK